jgi:Skp family chaperone for outer membrane proteins
MKKRLLFAVVAAAMMVSCGGDDQRVKKQGEDAQSTENTETPTTLSDSTKVKEVECVATGDVVYFDPIYVMFESKLYAAEGMPLEQKLQDFQTRATAARADWAKKEQNLANEYNKLQQDAAQLEQDYAKGLITTIKAQERGEALQKSGESLQKRMESHQKTMQTEAQKLQDEEYMLADEDARLQNRFNELAKMAIEEINSDNRYKMILNAQVVIDADETLNISPIVLQTVDRLYMEGALPSNTLDSVSE